MLITQLKSKETIASLVDGKKVFIINCHGCKEVHFPEKEADELQKEMMDLEKAYGGIKEMSTLPSAVFIVDTRKERNAVLEAKKLGIPVVAIVDTNCDPDDADYIIPGNDDAIRAIKLIAGALANAVIEAHGGVQEEVAEVAEEAAVEEAAE